MAYVVNIDNVLQESGLEEQERGYNDIESN